MYCAIHVSTASGDVWSDIAMSDLLMVLLLHDIGWKDKGAYEEGMPVGSWTMVRSGSDDAWPLLLVLLCIFRCPMMLTRQVGFGHLLDSHIDPSWVYRISVLFLLLLSLLLVLSYSFLLIRLIHCITGDGDAFKVGCCRGRKRRSGWNRDKYVFLKDFCLVIMKMIHYLVPLKSLECDF